MLSIFLAEDLEARTRIRAGETGTTANAEGEALLLFHFRDNQDEKHNNATAVLRSLVYQLTAKCPVQWAEPILSLFFESPEKTQATLASAEALWMIMRRLLQSPDLGTVVCMLDGLDECDAVSADLLAEKFCDFYLSPDSSSTEGGDGGRFKLLIVSRRMDGTRLHAFPQVRLDPDNDEYVNRDI